MQKTTYGCDQCLKDIGEVTHISLSFSGYSGIAVPPNKKQPRWTIPVQITGKFMHFCTGHCLKTFFDKLIGMTIPDKKKKR